ncbi:MAG: GNAT family N-acetyltransferase [Alphaproteobacteria bacterium]|nr:GNAT family N-acetyltransferase [Alphaproteobacteria bacterium]
MGVAPFDPARLERLAFASWPSLETEGAPGGWIRRYSKGWTERGNSVFAVGRPPEPDPEAAISAVEAWSRRRGIPPRFHVSPQSEPADLDDRLAARGYASHHATTVMAAYLDGIPATMRVGESLSLTDRPGPDWAALMAESAEDGAGRVSLVAAIAAPKALVGVKREGKIAAIGLGVLVEDMVGLSAMRTRPEYRRQGLCQACLAALAAWARTKNAIGMLLQVETDNAPARALYARVGFQDAFEYHYRVL